MNILQVSKIADTAFTFCKVRLKNVFHVKKIFASVDFCLYFCAIQKTHIVNTIFGYLF